MKKTLRILLTLMLFVAVSLTTFAYDFYSAGIYYNITDRSKKTVEVTRSSSNPYFDYSIVIPSTVTYSETTYTVTSIGRSVFKNCIGLSRVEIPNSVTSICDDAFYGCTGLTSVTIPNSVISIYEDAFSRCTGLISITLSNSEFLCVSNWNSQRKYYFQ